MYQLLPGSSWLYLFTTSDERGARSPAKYQLFYNPSKVKHHDGRRAAQNANADARVLNYSLALPVYNLSSAARRAGRVIATDRIACVAHAPRAKLKLIDDLKIVMEYWNVDAVRIACQLFAKFTVIDSARRGAPENALARIELTGWLGTRASRNLSTYKSGAGKRRP